MGVAQDFEVAKPVCEFIWGRKRPGSIAGIMVDESRIGGCEPFIAGSNNCTLGRHSEGE